MTDQPMTVEQLINLLQCFARDNGPNCKVAVVARGNVYAVSVESHDLDGEAVAVLWHR